jgi:hypothetical protein
MGRAWRRARCHPAEARPVRSTRTRSTPGRPCGRSVPRMPVARRRRPSQGGSTHTPPRSTKSSTTCNGSSRERHRRHRARIRGRQPDQGRRPAHSPPASTPTGTPKATRPPATGSSPPAAPAAAATASTSSAATSFADCRRGERDAIVDNRSETALSRPGNDSAGQPRYVPHVVRTQLGRRPHASPSRALGLPPTSSRLGYRDILPLLRHAGPRPGAPHPNPHRHAPAVPALRLRPLEDGTPWVPVRYAPGVSDLLMTDGKPAYAPEAAVEALQATEASRRMVMAPGPRLGRWHPCEAVLGGNQRVEAS